MKKFALLGIIASVFLWHGAIAGEADVSAPRYRNAAPAPMWEGFYFGVAAGYGRSQTNWVDAIGFQTGDFRGSGATLGVTGGHNWQSGRWVYGVEGDISYANISATSQDLFLCFPIGCTTELSLLSTFRARLGYLHAPHTLFYVTAGLAAGTLKHGNALFQSATSTEFGWTIGAGIEKQISNVWAVKGEYLYVELNGSEACSAAVCLVQVNNDYYAVHLFRLGFNRHF